MNKENSGDEAFNKELASIRNLKIKMMLNNSKLIYPNYSWLDICDSYVSIWSSILEGFDSYEIVDGFYKAWGIHKDWVNPAMLIDVMNTYPFDYEDTDEGTNTTPFQVALKKMKREFKK